MMIMHSRGLIHENSLLEMNIISKSLHSALKTPMNSMRYGARNWTTLGCWLGIYRNEELQQLLDFFNKNSFAKPHTTKQVPEVLSVEKVDVEDDHWDKELIDEIQREHIINFKRVIFLFLTFSNSSCFSES